MDKYKIWYVLFFVFWWFLGGDLSKWPSKVHPSYFIQKFFTHVTMFLTQLLIQKYYIEFFLPLPVISCILV